MMRPRRRYLVVQLHGLNILPSEVQFREAIWQQLKQLYGELGVSRIGFWLVAYDHSSKSAIIRCQHDQVRALRAALATITQMGPHSLVLHVVGISGTIRKAKTFLPGIETPAKA